MGNINAQGSHVFLDYTAYSRPDENDGEWMLELLERVVDQSSARKVHAHVEQFDGQVSPNGFAAVVLIDESHVTAHCYSDKGWLAVDCFTCGTTNPDQIADEIHRQLLHSIPAIHLQRRERVDRFLHEGE